jgi:DnaJ-class molecular chaperone
MAKKKEKKLSKSSKCLDCGGKGSFDDGEVKCLSCKGSGKVK